jgi:hypothetical protein
MTPMAAGGAESRQAWRRFSQGAGEKITVLAREAAHALAEREWPRLYDEHVLRANEVPAAAACERILARLIDLARGRA